MNNLFTILITSLTLITTTTCSNAQVNSKAYGVMLNSLLSHSVPEITTDSAAKIVDLATFIDARETNEYKVSHIKNAINVGYDELNLAALDSIDKSTPIVVYCSVGYRSEKVTEKLIQKGFTNVSNMYGGIFEWSNDEYPLYNGDVLTKNIHAYNRVWGQWIKTGVKIYE